MLWKKKGVANSRHTRHEDHRERHPHILQWVGPRFLAVGHSHQKPDEAGTERDGNNWQDDATAKNDEETVAEAQYATLLPEVKNETDRQKSLPGGIILLSAGAILLGGTGLMRWKGIV